MPRPPVGMRFPLQSDYGFSQAVSRGGKFADSLEAPRVSCCRGGKDRVLGLAPPPHSFLLLPLETRVLKLSLFTWSPFPVRDPAQPSIPSLSTCQHRTVLEQRLTGAGITRVTHEPLPVSFP